ncbi:hypothetical protein B0H99_12413 [Planomicrobium soli]|uniref:Uncharacterized protein n=1 Tax=Planomicrobium soli TaxID=1176648 RepID=A0A2P8FS61_9BACL|nr:hypothetical protein B0H99_12413 [Planomicrobium soli]
MLPTGLIWLLLNSLKLKTNKKCARNSLHIFSCINACRGYTGASAFLIVQLQRLAPRGRFGLACHGKKRHGIQALQRLSGLHRRFRFSYAEQEQPPPVPQLPPQEESEEKKGLLEGILTASETERPIMKLT